MHLAGGWTDRFRLCMIMPISTVRSSGPPMPSTDLVDHLRFSLAEAWGEIGRYVSTAGWWTVLAFLPFILLDLRRFLAPSLVLLLLRRLGLPRERSAAQARFLATRPAVSV